MQYGLIGEHLGHSYSQEIHGSIADYRYELKELAPDELDDFFKARAFRGINVTIPYKQAVMSYLDGISEQAQRIGAVNTVVNRGGKLFGYNTDFAGLCDLVHTTGVEPAGGKVLILGTGGTSKTAHAVAQTLGAAQIVHVSRRGGQGSATYDQAIDLHGDADVIINTTPVGMYPNVEASPIDLAPFPRLRGVLDVIYNPLRTELVLDAQERGIPAAGGLYMLCAQAVYASAWFQGIEVDPVQITSVYQAMRNQKQNIVLIGMPTAGKTTVGKLLAQRMGKQFYDTDDEICKRVGGTIADYINAHGEAEFRALEREVVGDLARQSGSIIATGGGAVLDSRNIRALKRTGQLMFLDRALDKLVVTADRPLANHAQKLEALFAARRPIYQGAADHTIEANGAPEEVADAVLKRLEQ